MTVLANQPLKKKKKKKLHGLKSIMKPLGGAETHLYFPNLSDIRTVQLLKEWPPKLLNLIRDHTKATGTLDPRRHGYNN